MFQARATNTFDLCREWKTKGRVNLDVIPRKPDAFKRIYGDSPDILKRSRMDFLKS